MALQLWREKASVWTPGITDSNWRIISMKMRSIYECIGRVALKQFVPAQKWTYFKTVHSNILHSYGLETEFRHDEGFKYTITELNTTKHLSV
jgi:hypothetical protein